MTFKETIKDLAHHAKEMRVLYVEDEDSIRENTKSLLEMIFSSVDVAPNGNEGLKLYGQAHYDIVITDILMPVMGGLEMIEGIKKITPLQPILVTSACEESNYLLDLINLGVMQFILKPIAVEHLVDALYSVVMNIYNARKVEELTHHLEQEVVHQSTLLEQYKDVVDIAMIVSKTDIKGHITYVNDAYCKVTGYSESELLGQKCTLTRHPDVAEEIHTNLWKSILEKKSWHGTLKNRKKDGGYYITDSTVKPILDEHGNIIEFINIEYDITMLFDLNDEIWQTQHELLYILGEVGETRSQETGHHVRRVAEYSKLLAALYGLDETQTHLLYSASPMHDIGKIGIPDAILLKPEKLSAEEYESMKKHTEIGHNIFRNSNRPMLDAASIIAYEHHEKYDGSGYPRGIKGEEIHIFGRITALADVFDALHSDRVYKKAWPLENVIAYIQSERGKHFDPKLVDLFMENLDRFIEISQQYSDDD